MKLYQINILYDYGYSIGKINVAIYKKGWYIAAE